MALPAFTVHSVVKYSAKAFVNQKNVRVRAWGPTLTGLAVVPRTSTPDDLTNLLSYRD
jgi:fission process protein 1